MSNFNKKEVKTIKLLNSKMNYDSAEDVERICTYLEDNKIMTSDMGVQYLNALKEYRDTQIRQVSCIFCGKHLADGEKIVCKKCLDIEDAIKPDTSLQKTSVSKKNAHKVSKRVIALITIISLIIAIAGSLFFIKKNKKIDVLTLLENFDENISESGFNIIYLNETEDKGSVYEISPTGELLYIFKNAEQKITGTALEMYGQDENSRNVQKYLMNALNKVYFDIDDEDSSNIINSLSENKGVFRYRNHRCLLILDKDIALYYILDEGTLSDESKAMFDEISKRAGNQENSSDVALDGVMMIGQPKTVADRIFGESTPLITENTLFYPDAGISIVYDMDTQQIIYIDNDGTGNIGNISIGGAMTGQGIAAVLTYYNDQGISFEMNEYGTYKAYVNYDDKDIEIDISTAEDKVSLISATLIGYN